MFQTALFLALLSSAPLENPESPASAPSPSPSPVASETAQFLRALENQSTAPSLVVISVSDGSGAPSQTYCTGANFLLGAIHIEHSLPYNESGEARAMKLALAGHDSGFVFRKRKALANISRLYSPAELEWAIAVLSRYSNQDLVSAFARKPGPFFEDQLYASRPSPRQHLRFALGHAIYLRGLNVGTGCVSSNLWVSQ